MDGAALDRPRPHQRHLHRQVVEVLRQACAAASASAPGSRSGRRRSSRPRWIAPQTWIVVERHVGEVDPLTARARDLVDAALHRREHPQPEQVDLQEAGVRARVLVPLDDLTSLHRRRLHRAELDQRGGGDHHAAGVLGDVAGQSRDLAAAARRAPASAASGPAARRAPPPSASRPRGSPRRRPRPARTAPPRRAAARAPCRGRGSPRAPGRWRRTRPAPSAPARSARAPAGSASPGCRGGSRGRCRGPR